MSEQPPHQGLDHLPLHEDPTRRPVRGEPAVRAGVRCRFGNLSLPSESPVYATVKSSGFKIILLFFVAEMRASVVHHGSGKGGLQDAVVAVGGGHQMRRQEVCGSFPI